MSTFRVGRRREIPLRQRAVFRVVSGPRPGPWAGNLADLAFLAGLTPRDAREGLVGLMLRGSIHVDGTEEALSVLVLKRLQR